MYFPFGFLQNCCTGLFHLCGKFPVLGLAAILGVGGAVGSTSLSRDIDTTKCVAAFDPSEETRALLEKNKDLISQTEKSWKTLSSATMPPPEVLNEILEYLPQCGKQDAEEILRDEDRRQKLAQLYFYNLVHQHGLTEAEERYRAQNW